MVQMCCLIPLPPYSVQSVAIPSNFLGGYMFTRVANAAGFLQWQIRSISAGKSAPNHAGFFVADLLLQICSADLQIKLKKKKEPVKNLQL